MNDKTTIERLNQALTILDEVFEARDERRVSESDEWQMSKEGRVYEKDSDRVETLRNKLDELIDRMESRVWA